MSQLKTGKCAICLEETMVKDVTGIVIFWSKNGLPNFNGNICEGCFKELVKNKGLWSKDGVNGMKLRY